MKHSYRTLHHFIQHAYTGRHLKQRLVVAGIPKMPANITDMKLSGEAPEYILAACLAVSSVGA